MNKYKRLKELILSDETLVVPDAYSGLTARLIEFSGFKAVQCSGYSFSVSKMYKDESLITLDENLSISSEIVKAVEIPVFADGEDGYGSDIVFENNIQKFMDVGISGINIEDQNIWCPFYNEKVLPIDQMIEKINIINRLKEKNGLPDFILNFRTDILGTFEDRKRGLSEAINRANLYLDAGADISFITNVKTKDEIRLLKKEINGPISIAAGLAYNIDNYDINDCREIGVSRVSLPSTLLLSSIKSQLDSLDMLNRSGSFKDIKNNLVDIDKLNRVR